MDVYSIPDYEKENQNVDVTPWAVDVGRRKRVKCCVQGSRRRKRVLCYVQGASICVLYNPGIGSFAQGRIFDPEIKSAF
ncbi:hypothetical protein Tco_0865912 [Tanacetum coccineum]